jgi:hypothetical protein
VMYLFEFSKAVNVVNNTRTTSLWGSNKYFRCLCKGIYCTLVCYGVNENVIFIVVYILIYIVHKIRLKTKYLKKKKL